MKFFSPISLSKSSDECVVLLPGYTGGAGAFNSIIELFDSDIFSYQYPGHGSDYLSFNETDSDMWLSGALEFVRNLKDKYKRITLCGYSMGGAIAILISRQIAVDRLILFAPALVSHEVMEISSRPVDIDSINPRLKAMCDREDLEIIKFYLEHDNSVMQRCLESIVSKARASKVVNVPSYAFFGKNDVVETFDEEERMCVSLGLNVFVEERSTHAILYDDSTPLVIEKLKTIL